MAIQTTDPSDPYLNITIQWVYQQLDNQNYTITISPPAANSGAVFHTFDTFIQLALLYDQDYNISMIAQSCIRSSTPAEINIRIIDNCSLIKDDVLINYCLSSKITTVTTTDEVMVSKFTNDSTSDLDPQQHGLSMHII